LEVFLSCTKISACTALSDPSSRAGSRAEQKRLVDLMRMDAAAAPDLIKAANLFGTRPRFIRNDLTAKALAMMERCKRRSLQHHAPARCGRLSSRVPNSKLAEARSELE
jgi:hypothetical protein